MICSARDWKFTASHSHPETQCEGSCSRKGCFQQGWEQKARKTWSLLPHASCLWALLSPMKVSPNDEGNCLDKQANRGKGRQAYSSLANVDLQAVVGKLDCPWGPASLPQPVDENEEGADSYHSSQNEGVLQADRFLKIYLAIATQVLRWDWTDVETRL